METTSPYLTRDTSSKVGAYGKMLPPFREPESRLALWDGIRKGLIDTIGTDNVTMTSAEKKMPQGMAGADAGYPALGTHLGMLTDSRSYASYPRFDFFRRILCDTVGAYVERGEYDAGAAEALVRGICYENVREFLGIGGKTL